MSLALAIHAYKYLLDSMPMEFATNLGNAEGPPMPAKLDNIQVKTSFGSISEEDYTWLIK